MRYSFVAALFVAIVSAAPMPQEHKPYDGVLGDLIHRLSGITAALGEQVNDLTNNLGQGPN